eukprot:gene18680-37714_t
MSFHGVPERTLHLGDPYHCEARKTGRLLAERLGLREERYRITFQSRFDKTKTPCPYTQPTIEALGKAGTRRVDVVCPGFTSDCLETLEEINMEAREAFLHAGGQEFHYIPCLNDDPEWITALCNLAQIDQHALQRRNIDMRSLAMDTWTLVRSGETERRIEIQFDPLPAALGAADLVAQVWQNLLHNAWKYTARLPLARIRVDSFQENRRTWFRVTDNGAGFDMAHARALFQPFRRMHAASQFEGSGIGLSMVQRIVQHHGARGGHGGRVHAGSAGLKRAPGPASSLGLWSREQTVVADVCMMSGCLFCRSGVCP